MIFMDLSSSSGVSYGGCLGPQSLGVQVRTRPWGESRPLSMAVMGPAFSQFRYALPFFPEMLIF